MLWGAEAAQPPACVDLSPRTALLPNCCLAINAQLTHHFSAYRFHMCWKVLGMICGSSAARTWPNGTSREQGVRSFHPQLIVDSWHVVTGSEGKGLVHDTASTEACQSFKTALGLHTPERLEAAIGACIPASIFPASMRHSARVRLLTVSPDWAANRNITAGRHMQPQTSTDALHAVPGTLRTLQVTLGPTRSPTRLFPPAATGCLELFTGLPNLPRGKPLVASH